MASPSTNADCAQDEKPDLILKAGNTLFKVPSFYFRRESKVFQDMYQLPQGDAAPADGSSEERPRLSCMCILRVMFPSSLEAEDTLSADEWKSVLKLSHITQSQDGFTMRSTHSQSGQSQVCSDAAVLDDIDLALAICALRESCYVGHYGSINAWYIRSGRESMEGADRLLYEQRIRQDFEAWIPKDEIP
ncbi:hypothetical protein BKA70DRAFT_1340428 [Coprinopsis sp. MPI-PUGE-AT-0042]|nr:hypothetical protein BKA70DRAFT_1340428 [Coprinopsis sp. MPI-PUGE-AT-0042]